MSGVNRAANGDGGRQPTAAINGFRCRSEARTYAEPNGGDGVNQQHLKEQASCWWMPDERTATVREKQEVNARLLFRAIMAKF